MNILEKNEPGRRAAREGDEDVISWRNHGVGGHSEPELPKEVSPKAISAESGIVTVGISRDGRAGLALEAQTIVVVSVADSVSSNWIGILVFNIFFFILLLSVAI